jgi:glutamine amidotransferase
MKLVIVKYNAGNIQSVLYALERIGLTATVTDDREEIQTADKVIFPGVGEASTAMQYLQERGLDKLISSLSQPVLGICLGMQLMCRHSEENDTKCLGIFDEQVKLFKTAESYNQSARSRYRRWAGTISTG